MKAAATLALGLSLTSAALAEGASEAFEGVSPALQRYGDETLANGLWTRPGLSPRDRSVVTLSAVITANNTAMLADQLKLALDNGVKPAEVSEIVTHLAFYAGWGNAVAAAEAAKAVFAERSIRPDQLPPASPVLLPLDEAAEATRARRVEESTGAASPGLVRDTAEVLFGDLWLRPDLAPRDRSLVTVSALVTSGQIAQIPFHLNRAMDNGLKRDEASEALNQLAYYAGWPKAFSAVPVFREVFEKRPAE